MMAQAKRIYTLTIKVNKFSFFVALFSKRNGKHVLRVSMELQKHSKKVRRSRKSYGNTRFLTLPLVFLFNNQTMSSRSLFAVKPREAYSFYGLAMQRFSCESSLVQGGAVATWLVRSTPERAGPGSSPGGDIVLCPQAKHFTLTVPLSTRRVYKWVPATLMLGVILRQTSIPSREEQKYSQSLHATGTGISSGLVGHNWLVCRLCRTKHYPPISLTNQCCCRNVRFYKTAMVIKLHVLASS